MSKYIDADELLKLLNAWKYPVNKTTRREITYNASISDACRCVDAMPAADVAEVRHGRWETLNNRSDYVKCSFCDYKVMHGEAPEWAYCPNCGASMDGDTE